MEIEKQKLLLSYLLTNQELYVRVSPILETEYFDADLTNTVGFIKKYFEEYKAAPNIDQVKAETGVKIDIRQSLTPQEIKYAENEIESFCKEKAIESAIFKSPKLLSEGKYGEIETLIKDAITVSLNRDLGLDYFANPEERLLAMSLYEKPIPTKIIDLDENLAGGLNRKELTIFAAPPGVGKSLTMSNIARNLISQNLNGVYITLELSQNVVGKRFDSIITGIDQKDILKNITKTSVEILSQKEGNGKFFIKRMRESTTNANHIRSYLKEFQIEYGFTPDFLVVDYMDLMCSNQKISAENLFIKDKYVSEELRSIADEYNLIMITASQLNRGAQQLESQDDLNQSHIAGGISKVNTADNLIAIIQTPAMKARGEMLFKMLKTRSSNGVGNQFMLLFNPVSLVLSSISTKQDDAKSKSLANYIRGKVATDKDKEIQQPKTSKMSINNLPFQV